MKNKITQLIRLLIIFSAVMFLLFCCNTKSYAASKSKIKRPKITNITKKTDSISIKWGKIADVTGYKIYISENDLDERCVATIKNPSINSYKIKGLKSNTKYTLKLKAYKRINKKLIYSAFSPAKKIKTKYGLGKGNFTCKKFSVNWDTKKWKKEDAAYSSWGYNHLSLLTKDSHTTSASSFYIGTTYLPISENGKGLNDYVSAYIDNDNNNYHTHNYERISDRIIDGKTFAVLHATRENYYYSKKNATFICPIGDELLEISYDINDNVASPEAKMQQIEELLSGITIK